MKNDDYLPHYTVGEEIFNSVSHGVGIALACVGFGILIILSVLYGDVWAVVSSIVYSFSLFTLYLSYPITWTITALAHMACWYVVMYKKQPNK